MRPKDSSVILAKLRISHNFFALLAANADLLSSVHSAAQGQETTVGERNLSVLAELLMGQCNNANQLYFDGWRKISRNELHEPVANTITCINAPNFGGDTFLRITHTETPQGPRSS